MEPASNPSSITQRNVSVLDSFLNQRECGAGQPIVLLHGNPTSSFVYRKLLPHLAPHGHCLAPDLIGMGGSGKPQIGYRYADHARYLDAWFDALKLRDVLLVGYDWGGILALDWAERHADRVRGVAVFETFLRPLHWSDMPPQGAELFRALRTPGVGEALVLERNQFLPRSLEHGIQRGLSDADRGQYYAPYPDAASRLPMLQWPREIPIDGEPAATAAVVTRTRDFLVRTHLPKLLLTFGTTGLNAPALVDSVRSGFAPSDIVDLGPAGHHAPEDAAPAIAEALIAWMQRHA